jgi:transposase-like protein
MAEGSPTSSRQAAGDTTTDKDRKQLLRTLLDEVHITVRRDDSDPHAELLLRFAGGALSELTVPLRRPQPSIRTDEDTIDLLHRLAVHYPDTKIAGILNRQGSRTASGLSYTASRVASLRHHWNIPCHQPTDEPPEGDLLNVTAAARQLGIAPSTLLRWLNDGFVAGEQLTPGAPWRIRITDELRHMLVDNAPNGWLALHHASRALGVSRQTVLQKVKRGELEAVLTRTGRRKGLRINVPTPTDSLF